jgi:hypothetical protein
VDAPPVHQSGHGGAALVGIGTEVVDLVPDAPGRWRDQSSPALEKQPLTLYI